MAGHQLPRCGGRCRGGSRAARSRTRTRTAMPVAMRRFRPGHPDHVELVEVAGEDREEPRPLQQRDVGVLGQLEHALVERQPRDLAVGEAVLGQVVGLLVPELGRGAQVLDDVAVVRRARGRADGQRGGRDAGRARRPPVRPSAPPSPCACRAAVRGRVGRAVEGAVDHHGRRVAGASAPSTMRAPSAFLPCLRALPVVAVAACAGGLLLGAPAGGGRPGGGGRGASGSHGAMLSDLAGGVRPCRRAGSDLAAELDVDVPAGEPERGVRLDGGLVVRVDVEHGLGEAALAQVAQARRA